MRETRGNQKKPVDWAQLEFWEAKRGYRKSIETKAIEFLIRRSQVRALPWTPIKSCEQHHWGIQWPIACVPTRHAHRVPAGQLLFGGSHASENDCSRPDRSVSCRSARRHGGRDPDHGRDWPADRSDTG